MCQTEYQNDPSIADSERLFRRIHLKQIVKDEDTGLARISSGAFRDKDLSVDIESILLSMGEAPTYCLQNQTAFKLVCFTAGQARQLQQLVCRDPQPHNSAHGIVYGSKNSRRVHDGLSRLAQWVIPVEAPQYADIEAEKHKLGMIP